MRRGGRVAGSVGTVLAALAAGCAGPTHVPVEGAVVWTDNTPARELAGGVVEFESADGLRSARGEIGPDGAFALSSRVPGDGVPPGEYRVVVVPPPSLNPDRPARVVEPRFLKYDTSGLAYTVRPERNSGVVFTVERAKR